MLQLGTWQKLKIVHTVEFGAYLAESGGEERVLLPAAQVPEGAAKGDEIDVFLYLDSRDRPIATVRDPLIHLHEVRLLSVKETNPRAGAFLDIGLERDLLLPFREQTAKVKAGDTVLAAMYLDKSGRLCATMNVYPYLKTNSPYRIGDEVRARAYETSRNFGVFVAVDDIYSALIPKREAQGKPAVGAVLKLRVTEVKEDGKLTVSPRQKAYQQIRPDAELIREALRETGELPFDDKAAPEVIAERFGMSKAAFKRAVGHLLKEKEIEIRDGKIIAK